MSYYYDDDDCNDGLIADPDSAEEQRRREGFVVRSPRCHGIDCSDSECGSAKSATLLVSHYPVAATPDVNADESDLSTGNAASDDDVAATTARTPPPTPPREPPKRRKVGVFARVTRPCFAHAEAAWCTRCKSSSKTGSNRGKCRGPKPELCPDDCSGCVAVDNASSDDSFQGRLLRKDFPGFGVFTGRVVTRNSDGTYAVVYTDGDGEDLTEEELGDCLVDDVGRRPVCPWAPLVANLGLLSRRHRTSTRPPPRARSRAKRRNLRGGDHEATEKEIEGVLLFIERFPHETTVQRTVRRLVKQKHAEIAECERLSRKHGALVSHVRRLRRRLAGKSDDDGSSWARATAGGRCLLDAGSIGLGFNAMDDGRSRRMHAADWERQIVQRYPNDIAKQVQVATDLARRFSVCVETRIEVDGVMMSTQEIKTCVSIAQSFKDMGATLLKTRVNGKGRLRNKLRTPYRCAAMAASLPNDIAGLDARSKYLNYGLRLMKAERARWKAWLLDKTGDDLVTFRGAVRSDAYPEEWLQMIRACWCEVARRSEKKDDELIDKDSKEKGVKVRKCYLEIRVGRACDTIMGLCADHFKPDFKYADDVCRPNGFTAKSNFVRCLRPYYVIKSFGKRETSLCVYHLKWHFVAKALATFQRRLRDTGKVPKDQPCLPVDPSDMRRALLCPRVTHDEFDNVACRNNKCETCKDLRLLVGKDGGGGLLAANELNSASHGTSVRWDRWEKHMNPVTGKLVWDFHTTTTSIDGVIEELMPPMAGPVHGEGHRPGWFVKFCTHNFVAKWIERAKKWKRNRFPRGSVHVVMDFSENGKFGVKLEHQTRYYQTHGYTLFGMVLDSWIDDHLDTSLSPELKTRLKKLMDDNGRPHIITTTHIVASEDTLHDPSSVMHYTSKVLIPWCKKTLKGFAAGDGVMYLSTDGAPTQFDHRDIYLYVSRSKQVDGVKMDWNIGAAAHGKDLSDSECGSAKHCIDKANFTHVASGDGDRGERIDTVPKVIRQLEKPPPAGFKHTVKDIYEKKGKGIYDRVFHHVPLRKISRRIAHAKTLSGCKPLHQFLCIGKSGKLLVRDQPCHYCPGCMALDPERIMNECKYDHFCGKARVVSIEAASGATALPADRDGMEKRGVELAKQAAVGSFVAIDLPFNNLAWMMGEVLGVCTEHKECDGRDGDDEEKTGEDDFYAPASMVVGDLVLRVRRWMPLECGGGSSIFEEVLDGVDHAVTLVPAKHVRHHLLADVANDKEFKPRRAKRGDASVVNLKVGAGTVFEYMFADQKGKWYRGTCNHMNDDGTTGNVRFDDDDPYTNLPLWGNLFGARLRIVEKGLQYDAAKRGPLRTLLPAVKADIVAAVGW